MLAARGALGLPVGCFLLPLSASFGTGLTLAPGEGEGSPAACITDATESYTSSPASLLILLPWSLAAALRAYQTAQRLPGGHRRSSALRDLPRLTAEQLIKNSDYFS